MPQLKAASPLTRHQWLLMVRSYHAEGRASISHRPLAAALAGPRTVPVVEVTSGDYLILV